MNIANIRYKVLIFTKFCNIILMSNNKFRVIILLQNNKDRGNK